MQLIIYYQKQQRRGLFVVTSIHIHSFHARTHTHTLERRRDSQFYVGNIGICFFQAGWMAGAPAPMHSPCCQVVVRLSVLLSVDSTIFRVNERQKMCFACWRHVPSNSLLLALFSRSRHLIFGLSSRITCIHSQQFRSIGFCLRSTTNVATIWIHLNATNTERPNQICIERLSFGVCCFRHFFFFFSIFCAVAFSFSTSSRCQWKRVYNVRRATSAFAACFRHYVR